MSVGIRVRPGGRAQHQRPDDTGHNVQREHRRGEGGSEGGDLGQQNRVRANRQRRQHQNVPLVRKHGAPPHTAKTPTTSMVVAIRKCSALQAKSSRPCGCGPGSMKIAGGGHEDAQTEDQGEDLQEELAGIAPGMR